MKRWYVTIPEHCGLPAVWEQCRFAWCCPSCGLMLLTDEMAYRSRNLS
jgi:hypothetical protein